MNHMPDANAVPLVLTPPGEDLDETYGVTRTCEDAADRIVEAHHEHDWAHPRVAVGSGVWDTRDVDAVLRAGITHVLDCRGSAAGERLYRGTGVVHFACPTNDDGERKPAAWFRRGVSFARDALSRPGAKLLVHCAAGVNRGPSMAYAVLRAVIGLGPTEAERAIKTARPLARMCYRDDAERAVASLR